MALRLIRPDALADFVPARGLVWVQGCSGESPLVRDGLLAAGDRLAGTTFTGIFVPRLNRMDYLLGKGRRVRTYFMTAEFRRAPEAVEFLPICYREIIAHLGAIRIDAALFPVAPPDENGLCSFGPVADFLPALWRTIPVRIAHINPALPRTRGHDAIPYDEITVVIEGDAELPGTRPLSEDDTTVAIARHIAALVPEGATILAGLGRMPEAALGGLKHHRNLRIHSGLIGDAVLDLLEAGAIASERSITTGVAIGSKRLYAAIDRPEFHFKPAVDTHSREVMAKLENFVTINSVAEIDLLGAAYAEHASGGLISGPGGASDFCAGAAAAGGTRILVLASSGDGGETGKIIAPGSSNAPVSLSRFDTDYVVTEQGVARISGLSHRARAEALIGVAHPRHRPALEAAAQAWAERFTAQ
jgi:acyl-CoA hydrolase